MTEPVSLHDAEQTLEAAQPKQYAAYPAYRPSGVDWLGDVPQDWDVKRLKFLAQLINEKVLADEDSDQPYIGLEHVQSLTGKLLPLNDAFMPTGISNVFQPGDVLFGKLRPYLAKATAVDFKGLCSSELMVLRPNEVDRRFLFYAMLSDGFNKLVDSSTYGAKMPRANWEFIGSMRIPVPSPDEQQAIARFLDEQTKKIDDLIEAKRDLLALLKEKRQAVITHTVTKGLSPDATLKPSGVDWLGDVPEHWRIVLLRRQISEMRNGTSTNQNVESEHSVPVTRIETISNGFINFAKVGYVEYDKALEPYRLQRGDILMSHINSLPMIGNCAFYDSDKVLFNGMNVLRIQPKSDVHSEWLWRTLASDLYRQAIRSIAKPAINQASVTTTQLKQLSIPLPPHDEQQAIAKFLGEQTTKIDAVITEASAAITQLTEYRTALISATVTGKIDVRRSAV